MTFRIHDLGPVQDRASELVREMSETPDARIAFRCTEDDGRSRVLARILSEVPANSYIYVHVPDALDQTERVLLDVAQAIGHGGEVAKETDAALREQPEAPTTAFGILERALGGRRLVIDGWDLLGYSTMDREITDTQKERIGAVRNWLEQCGALFALGRGRAPANTQPDRWRPSGPPFELVDGSGPSVAGLWERFAPDVRQYELALMLLALNEGTEDEAIETATDQGLRSRIVDLLPDAATHLLRLLSMHERPIEEELVSGRPVGATRSTIELGGQIGLWRRMGHALLVEKGWCKWWKSSLNEAQRRSVHLELANLFSGLVRPADPEAGRAGVALLEAHRHFLAAGDLDRAKAYARYGATLLVDKARQQSFSNKFDEAARTYRFVVDAADEGSLPVGRQLKGYARHYMHYNRARAGLESYKETERGYREALDAWPENALFWSRLVRVLFHDNRPAEALNELEKARHQVPDHPLKRTFLIARTVRGLLDQNGDRMSDAILAWDGYHPDTEQAREVEERLAARLAEGWKTDRLLLVPEPSLFFTRPQEIQIERVTGGWLARIGISEMVFKGSSPHGAMQELVERLRKEAERLVRSYTPDLSPEDRLTKQRLLGAIDVVASKVDAPTPESIWVFGDLDRDDESRLWLHTGGGYDLWFEVPDSLAEGIVVSDLPYFALVRAEAGVPVGPVEKLERGVRGSEDEIWDEWTKRLQDAC